MLFGLAKSTFPVGAILGSILINYIAIKNNIKFLGKTLTAQSSLLVLMGLPLSYYGLNNLSVMNIYIILTVLLVLLGILNAMANIPIITIFQKMIPDNLRGEGIWAFRYLYSGFNTDLYGTYGDII